MNEAVFVGRSEEIARGQRAVDEASSGRGALLLFSGEAGIGKTRLADEVASIAARRDARVVWGRCWEAGGAPAYWPWIQILRSLGVEDDLFSGDDRDLRFRQFDRVAARLERIAAEGLLVVVLDDLHTADVPSLLFLHFLSRGLRDKKILVLGTYRDAEARLAPEVFALLAKIAREGDAVPVHRLSREDVLTWMRARTPDADDTTAERVHRTTEGNALFVQELLRVRDTARADGDLPDGLRAVLDEHLARVVSDVREVLATASVLGREIDASIVAAVAELPSVDVETKLRAAHEAGLLVSLRGGKRLAFAHILVRERLYHEIAPQRRAELHVAIAEHLLATKGEIATIAHHFVEGRSAVPPIRAARALYDAAQSAQRRLAFEDGARLARTGVELLSGDENDEAMSLACDLELAIGKSLVTAGDTKPGQEACLRARDLAKQIGAAERMARAALVYATDLVTGSIDPVMIALLRDAIDGLPAEDSPVRALVLARYAAARVPPLTSEDVPDIIASARAAMAMADRLPEDDDTRLFVYKFGSSATGYLVGSAERHAHVEKVAAIVEKGGHAAELLNFAGWWIANLREQGAITKADEVLGKIKSVVKDFPQPHYRWRIPMLEAQRALFAGDIAEAERLGREARAIDTSPVANIHWAMHRLSIALVREDPMHIRSEWDEVFGPLSRIGGANPFAGWRDAANGNVEGARARIEEALHIRESFPTTLLAGEATCMLGDRELAARLLPDLTRFATYQMAFWSSHGSLFVGPTSRIAARIAALTGNVAEARRLYEQALVECERMQLRPYIEITRKALAELDGSAPASRRIRATAALAMERDGDVWKITIDGRSIRVKDTKGLAYLADLVARPGEELHVTQLAELADSVTGDAGPVLDAKAKQAYKERVEALRDEVEEAARFGDLRRAARAEEEIEAIANQLASAVGLGGRDRKVGSHVERARINVQRRLKDAIQRIAEHDDALAKYLSAAVKTGTFCSFTPF